MKQSQKDAVLSSLQLIRFYDYRILGDIADIVIMDGQDERLVIICEIRNDIGSAIEMLEHRMKQCVLEKFRIPINVVITSDTQDVKLNENNTSDLSGMFVPITNVKKTILICSGKGGVGKSTIAAKLATTLSIFDKNVGIVDLDIYGPSIPDMFSIYDSNISVVDGIGIPISANGIQIMSIGFMLDRDQPAIWRGPILTKVVTKLMRQTAWSNLDYLIIDTPPGTGDVHISLMQKFPIDVAVLVSTSQNISLQNTSRTASMLKRFGIPIIGLVKNMVNLDNDSDVSIIDKINVIAKIPFDEKLSDTNYLSIDKDCSFKEVFHNFANLLISKLS